MRRREVYVRMGKQNTGGIPPLAQKFMLPGSRYDRAAADRVVAFVGQLRHTKSEWKGQPFHLLGWQEEIVRTIFGVIGEDGYRQFRTCYITLAKKGGKTSLAATIALYMLCADKEFGAEICQSEIHHGVQSASGMPRRGD